MIFGIDLVDIMYNTLPILALVLIVLRILQYRIYKDLIFIGRATVDLYLGGIYLWIALDSNESLVSERKEAVAVGFGILFTLNIFYSLIDLYRVYLNKKLYNRGITL